MKPLVKPAHHPMKRLPAMPWNKCPSFVECARLDDRRVLIGILFFNRNGLRWRDAPEVYGPHETLYSRWFHWSRMGVFARILQELISQELETEMIMIDVEQ